MRLLILALLPSIFIFMYVWKKDKVEKEPIGLLIKIFILGVLSIIPVLILEEICSYFISIGWDEGTTSYIIMDNFFGVALIEEWGKRKAAKIGAWKHPAFNYKFDAIVYCVVSALGFATLENILYVMENGLSVAITRALLSVPSHAIDGLMMGYFFGLAKEAEIMGDRKKMKRYYSLSLIVPVIDHGLFDSALSTDSGLIFFLFFVMVIGVDIWAFIFIKKQSQNDSPLLPAQENVQMPVSEAPQYFDDKQ